MRKVEWRDSAFKRRFDIDDVLGVMTYAVVRQPMRDRVYGTGAVLYLGYTRSHPSRLLEVIAHVEPTTQTITIFHVMPMRAKFQHLIDEVQGRK
jgi:hypothetical protein